MQAMFSNISFELFLIMSVFAVIFFLLLILNIVSLVKINKLKKKYNRFMGGFSNGNMEELLENCLQRVNEVTARNREIESHINFLERNLLQCVQKVGIVRYNAFENMGSDLSFSIALLDSNDNGIIFSGIYSRDNSSTYAKPVVSGKSKYTLSAEEIQALDIAKKMYRERLYTEN